MEVIDLIDLIKVINLIRLMEVIEVMGEGGRVVKRPKVDELATLSHPARPCNCTQNSAICTTKLRRFYTELALLLDLAARQCPAWGLLRYLIKNTKSCNALTNLHQNPCHLFSDALQTIVPC